MTQILVDNNKSEARVFLDEEVNSNDLTNVEHEETDRDMENSISEDLTLKIQNYFAKYFHKSLKDD